MLDLSIIILNYNTKNLTLKCLTKIIKSDLDKLEVEILLIDNASSDGSTQVFKKFIKDNLNFKIKLINNQENLGFAAGNNRGIRQARGKYILLLNSDVMVEKKTIADQVKFMVKNPKYQISTCKLILDNGRMDPACHRGLPNPWASLTYFTGMEKVLGKTRMFGGYHQGWKILAKTHKVDVISGAFLMAETKVFTQIGLFDEGYFMYGEDIDLCLRAKQVGFKIGFNPEVTAVHLKGESGRKDKQSKSHYYFWDTMGIFYKKHYSQKYPKPVMWGILKIINFKKGKYEDRH